MFDFRQLQSKITESHRAPWQDEMPSFSYDEMMSLFKSTSGNTTAPVTFAGAAGYTFKKVDRFLGELGNPIGIKSYKPYHSTGEDFLQTYLGMVGIPMDLVPDFPIDENIILLTETAKFDPEIINKIKNQLMNGRDVMITSGLIRALEDRGIGDIAELRYTDRKSLVKEFSIGWRGTFKGDTEILIPQIAYLTNDSWEMISGMDGGLGWPFLHKADYSKGTLFVLTIPENFADIYNLPSEVLSEIRKTLSEDLCCRIMVAPISDLMEIF